MATVFVPMLAPPDLSFRQKRQVLESGLAPDGWNHVEVLSRRYRVPEGMLMRESTAYKPLVEIEFGAQTPMTRLLIGGFVLLNEHQVAAFAARNGIK